MTVPTSLTTRALDTIIVAAAAGDKAAFSQLYQQFAPRVYNLVFRSVRNAHSAEDVCQEVWVRAYQKLPGLREPAAFSTWLYRIASRACIDKARMPAGQPSEVELPDQLVASALDEPEDTTIRRERERLLWQALSVLPARQHVALFFREVEGRSYQEIAGILDTTESAIETLLFRARRGVAEAFERLQVAGERCGQAKKTMAVLIDGEATSVQRWAVEAHVDECRTCRVELAQQRQVSAAYGVLPFLPLPALLGERVLQSLGTASVSAGGGVIAKLLGLATNVKLATAALTVTGGLTVATLAVPSDSLRLDLANATQAGAVSTQVTSSETAGREGAVPAATATLADLATAAAALAALQQLSHHIALAVPHLPQLFSTPAAGLDEISRLLTPPAVVPAVTLGLPATPPPVALPSVTPPVALPTLTSPVSLPTVALPQPLP